MQGPPASVRELYDRVADRYDEVVEVTRYGGRDWLAAALPAVADAGQVVRRVVDLGCANGALGRLLRPSFPHARLVGIDVAPRMLAAARAENLYDELLEHDLGTAPPGLAAGSVDVFVALGCLEFIAHPLPLLRSLHRSLRPGGWLFCSFQEHWPERAHLAPLATRSGAVPHHALTRAEVHDLLEQAALSPQSTDSRTEYVSNSGFACPYLYIVARRPATG
ncbi:MAG: class I SAM-dependent DNA methyltransferase [Betaproteobacteria bacterium]